MKHATICRMDFPALMRRAQNIKPVARAMTAKLEEAGNEIVASGVLVQIARGECHAD